MVPPAALFIRRLQAKAILGAYGQVDRDALHHSLVARAAVMTAWYPILYPNPDAERRAKLKCRIEWLKRGECSTTISRLEREP